MIKVLITGAGGDVGQGAIRSLLNSTTPLKIFTTCIDKYSSWLHEPNVTSFISPLASSQQYVPFLITILNKFEIDLLIPTVDSEISLISKNKILIESETKAIIFVDKHSSVSICDDKYLTYKFLKENNFEYLKTNLIQEVKLPNLKNNLKYPLIVKKRKGRGSKDIYIANKFDEIKKYIDNEDFIIQEYISKNNLEYTAGVYLGDENKFNLTCIFKRKLKNGSTFIAERIINEQISRQLISLAKKLKMKYVNIQFFYIDSKVIPFEFNGRLSGTIIMISKVFNIIELFIRERILKEDINLKISNELFIAMRYYEEIYTTPSEVEDLINRSKNFLK